MGWFDYDRDLFDAGTIDRMAGHFQTLLRAALADPDRSVNKLPLLTEGERSLLIEAGNGTPIDSPRDACLHHLFEAQVGRTPDRVALIVGDERLTYRELNLRAEGPARRLRRLGVGPEVPVAIHLRRSKEMILAILGVLKAGGAYVPLSPDYPPERLEYMLANSAAAVLVTTRELANGPPRHQWAALLVDDEEEAEACGATDSEARPGPGNLAYVLYTSGSTGRPKGVALEHRCIVSLVEWARRTFSDEQMAGMLLSTSFSFDLSVFELLRPSPEGERRSSSPTCCRSLRPPPRARSRSSTRCPRRLPPRC